MSKAVILGLAKLMICTMLLFAALPGGAVTFSVFITTQELWGPLDTGYGVIGFTYAGDMFVGSIYRGGTMSLYKTDLNGKNLALFAPSVNIPGGTSSEHFVSASLGKSNSAGDWPKYDIYVAGTTDIIHITHDGTKSDTFASGFNGQVRGIIFDAVGTFGYDMLVATKNGYVYRVTSTGQKTQLASLGEDTEGMDIASSGFGPYAGQLLTGSEGTGVIRAITPLGVVTALNDGTTYAKHLILGAENVFAVPTRLGTNSLDGYYVANYQSGGNTGDVRFASIGQFTSALGGLVVSSETSGSLTLMKWNGTGFDYTDNYGYISIHPEDGIFLTELQTNPDDGYMEICKAQCTNGNPVTGNFTFNATIDTFDTGPVTVPVGACSPPIQVPSGTVTVNEAVQYGVSVSDINAIGFDHRLNLENRLVSSNKPFRTADVTVVPGDVSTETITTFTNCQVGLAALKICKVAGSGVPLNYPFNFTLSSIKGLQKVVVLSGPPPGGYCTVAGTYQTGTQVFISEDYGFNGYFVSDIQVVPPDRGKLGFFQSVTVAIDKGVTEVTFTNSGFGRIHGGGQNQSNTLKKDSNSEGILLRPAE